MTVLDADTPRGPESAPRRVFIRTFGCQMNVYDSEKLYAFLAPDYLPAASPEEADLVLLNTCSVREKAEQKVYSLLGRLKPLKQGRPGLLVGVGGCVAQQEGERILERSPIVDLVFGTHTLDHVPDMVRERMRTGRRQCRVQDDSGRFPSAEAPRLAAAKPAAFITIMKGCDNLCAYCVVPLVRGREVSRPAKDILDEARHLTGSGTLEITLLGQNVNSYRDPERGLGFVGLLESLAALSGVKRLRFVTSHPKDFSQDLACAMADIPQVCEHIHLPFQAGSNRVLAAMKRGYTREAYLDKVRLLKDAVPEVELTTDVIVGFPGEEREDFDQTLSLIEQVRFQNAFSFRFSPRPGTAAQRMPDTLDPVLRRPWLPELQAVQNRITAGKHASLEGATVEVLVEGRGQDGGRLEGRTRNNYIVHFDGADAMIGRMARVKVTRSRGIHLEGEMAPDPF